MSAAQKCAAAIDREQAPSATNVDHDIAWQADLIYLYATFFHQ